jgi:hypothetical protein
MPHSEDVHLRVMHLLQQQDLSQRKTAEYEALRSEIESPQREVGKQAGNV